ncbi:hypothetical protein J2D69_19225 [Lysinibacillus sphaericus]|uniref:hypothetical protein n=1 Tax=Lysinibacillus sphaericus TaxID=1421 RepID=UPI001A9E6097|nr:hypothetical protein [Lysinibacillus sphaericus]QTB17405.1 hypothetical protein J2D69_19225 [Lysinibacillus sphaericus]
MSNFSQNERYVLSLFSPNNEFVYGGVRYKVVESGKPTSSKGEPKTDIYVMSISLDNSKYLEFKISFKQDNADFLENKMTAERAEQIRGLTLSGTKTLYDNGKQIRRLIDLYNKE